MYKPCLFIRSIHDGVPSCHPISHDGKSINVLRMWRGLSPAAYAPQFVPQGMQPFHTRVVEVPFERHDRSIELFDPRTGIVRTITREECGDKTPSIFLVTAPSTETFPYMGKELPIPVLIPMTPDEFWQTMHLDRTANAYLDPIVKAPAPPISLQNANANFVHPDNIIATFQAIIERHYSHLAFSRTKPFETDYPQLDAIIRRHFVYKNRPDATPGQTGQNGPTTADND